MVVEKDGVLQKVQVKFAGLYSKGGVCKVGLRITGGNQSFSYTKKYTNNAFDLLFVYTEKGEQYLIPWKEVTSRNELSIETKSIYCIGNNLLNKRRWWSGQSQLTVNQSPFGLRWFESSSTHKIVFTKNLF
jgi:hypothetical protein